MAELERLPPHLQRLFQPCPSPRYLEPIDHAPEKRCTPKITGVASYLELLRQPDPDYVPTESWLVKQQREKRLKNERQKVTQQERKEAWDPKKDDKIIGDPFKTLFVGRLAYDVTENDLEETYSKYGAVEKVRIVRDRESGKSNGYGFVVFQKEDDFRKAFQFTSGTSIKGRKVVVDVERGRTVSGWLPRRLGGGKGGRHYTKENERDRRPLGPAGGPGRDGRDSFQSRDRSGPRPRDPRDSRDPRGSRPPDDFRGSFRGGRGGREGRDSREYRDRDPRDREPRDRDPRDRDRRPQYRDRSPPPPRRGEMRGGRGGFGSDDRRPRDDRDDRRGGSRGPTKYY